MCAHVYQGRTAVCENAAAEQNLLHCTMWADRDASNNAMRKIRRLLFRQLVPRLTGCCHVLAVGPDVLHSYLHPHLQPCFLQVHVQAGNLGLGHPAAVVSNSLFWWTCVQEVEKQTHSRQCASQGGVIMRFGTIPATTPSAHLVGIPCAARAQLIA